MLISTLTAARHAPRVAAGCSKRSAAIWNFETGVRLAELKGEVLEEGFGLVLSSDGSTCVAWGYGSGVALYNALQGTQLWHRRDVKGVRMLSPTRAGSAAYCVSDHWPTRKLDLRTGQSRISLRDFGKIWESPFAPVVLHQRNDLVIRTDQGQQIGKIPGSIAGGRRLTIVCAAFSRDEVCFAPLDGPVRSFELNDGSEVWRYEPSVPSHVLHVAYSEPHARFFGVERNSKKAGPLKLLRFSEKGVPTVVRNDIQQVSNAVCITDRVLISAAGQVIDLGDGHSIRWLGF
jgi:hypothetical protein